jgi:hypothetical protein
MTGLSSPATVTATLCSQCVFKMVVSIQNPVKCEIHAVIRILHVKGETAAEIHRQLVSVYGEVVMNRQNVAKWCRKFESMNFIMLPSRPPVADLSSFSCRRRCCCCCP